MPGDECYWRQLLPVTLRIERLIMIAAARSPPSLFTLVPLTALSVLSLNMFLPSLPNIAQEFGTDYALASLSVAGYLGITAVLQLIMGPLSDRLGRRPVLLAGLVIFVAASLGCMLAETIWSFLVWRVLQGGDHLRLGAVACSDQGYGARAGGGKPDRLHQYGDGGGANAGSDVRRSTG